MIQKDKEAECAKGLDPGGTQSLNIELEYGPEASWTKEYMKSRCNTFWIGPKNDLFILLSVSCTAKATAWSNSIKTLQKTHAGHEL